VQSFLSGSLLTAVALLVPATAAVFTVGSDARRQAGTGPGRAVAAAVAVALLALGIGALLGAEPVQAAVTALVLGGSVAAWDPVARAWATRGLVAWALALDAGLLYLGYVLHWTVTAGLDGPQMVAGLALLLLEAFVFLIGVGYLWEFIDVLARRTWSAYVDVGRAAPDGARPFVSLHVPTHNEPPDMVIATLESLLALEYDDYEILLVDNNTTDPALWRPVEAFCARHERIRFLHLEDWPGFKSGALNEALRQTDPRAEVIGIVDADYLVRPDFLAGCAPIFADPGIAFVQTPQDYRDWEMAPYFRRLYYSYGYFFDVSQKSRNERNGAIFGGTMGLIRRSALAGAGGWDEWCITEDAELSLRLLKAGGRGVHVDQSFGHGVMPLTFEALKRQRFRWCFGGVQILRMHWRSLLPGRRTEANQLTLGQRWAYLVGALQWFGDLASVLFTGFLLLGAIDAVVGEGVVVRQLSGFLLVCVAALVLLGAVRSLALVRRTSGASWGEAFGAFGLWLALGWTVAQASFRGLFAREGRFLRTPKVRGELGLRHAVRGNLLEALVALVCAVVGVVAISRQDLGAVAVGVLVLVHAAGYAAAPLNSVAAIRSDLPEELRRRRRDMLPSWGAPVRRGGVVLVGTGALLLCLVVLAAPLGSPDLTRLQDDVTVPEPGETPTGSGETEVTPADDTGSATTADTTGVGSITTTSAPLPGASTGPSARPSTSPSTGPSTPPSTGPSTPPSTSPGTTRPPQATQPTQATTPTVPAPTSHPATTTQPTPTTRPTQGGGRPSTTPSGPG